MKDRAGAREEGSRLEAERRLDLMERGGLSAGVRRHVQMANDTCYDYYPGVEQPDQSGL